MTSISIFIDFKKAVDHTKTYCTNKNITVFEELQIIWLGDS